MLTNVQKETLNTLINLYQSSNGKSIRGEEIANVVNRNPGTIRNQMIYLRLMGLVKSTPGPGGGYKPTMEAYHSLNISVSNNDSKVPIFKNGEKIDNISVSKIGFTSVSQSSECEATIKVLGSIKDLHINDEIIIGPTPVNNLSIMGTIVGRDDLDNVLLVDTKTIRCIPKETVGDIAIHNVIQISIDCSLKDVAKKFSKKKIDGAPVVKDGKVVGVFTLNDLINAIVNNKKDATVGELMSKNIIIVNENLNIANTIEIMIQNSISRLFIMDNNQSLFGCVTKTELIKTMTTF